jgi:Pyridine nucleotide-disulphide oxidoreductase
MSLNPRRWFITIGVASLPLLAGFAMESPAGGLARVAAVDTPRAKVTNPHGPIGIPCQDCHTYTSWKPIRSAPEFNHDHTGYPLRGMHQKVACTQCHTSLVFKNVSKSFADCHADIHRRQFGANCESCHSVKGWHVSIQAIRNHQNRFPLVGAHALVDCEECHKSAAVGQFQGLSTACYSCHQKDFLMPVIDHVSSGFPTTCESCHTMDSWFGAKFDHLKFTGFALTGLHATLPCTACHINNQFKGTPADCFSCHSREYTTSNNPSHLQLALPHDCGRCHTTLNWSNAAFDHALYAHYPLTGLHAKVACAQCHVNNNYTTVPKDCYSCHKQNYSSATSPNHVAQGFPLDCTMCHTTDAWKPSSFDHSKVFPLTGAHLKAQCAQCHINNYKTVPKDCYSCHSANYVGTNNPSHLQLGLPHNCATCHSTANWLNASFNHALYAHYPLTGLHASVPCAKCHVNNNYTNTPTACASCHLTDYNKTTNPNHAAQGFPTDCSFCHSTAGWSPSTFDHSKVFPLTGDHLKIKCSQCHVNNNYTTLPTTCYGCHKSDCNGTTNPSHVAAGFPTQCDISHTTTDWSGASFDHSKTPFPLTGAHLNVPCLKCHINNVFAGTPTDCYSCHKAEYTGTTNPNHISAGFPTTCQTCHTTTSWLGATFNHTWFDTHHGGANGVCSTCHTVALSGIIGRYLYSLIPRSMTAAELSRNELQASEQEPGYGKFRQMQLSKEELLAFWDKIMQRADLNIRTLEGVETVKRGDDGLFQVRTQAAGYRSRAVILALGRMGTPRKLASKAKTCPMCTIA